MTGTKLLNAVPAAHTVPWPPMKVQYQAEAGHHEMTRVTLSRYCPGATLAGSVQVADTDQPMPLPPL